jgi:hypothetical protein
MYIRIRIIIAILGCLACALLNACRAGLNVAIVSMVVPTNITFQNITRSCIKDDHESNHETVGSGKFEWNEAMQVNH